ncbi:MAG: DUF2339 domain-containing protein [Flavipsychrobacter sp.]
MSNTYSRSMMTNNEHISRLSEKLDALLKKQNSFTAEINELRQEINALKNADVPSLEKADNPDPTPKAIEPTINTPAAVTSKTPIQNTPPQNYTHTSKKSNLEKFIGENLISKIGIIITIIGVSIGVKYSIDHQLISPATRIILGYLAGITLTLIGLKLRAKYKNYSAVLVSGAMAIMYFITFAAYNYYALMPQIAAFLLMVVITIATVGAAIKYNNQIIAHIGLVGAYAIPFLLSDGSGKVQILFSYMAIINMGILFIAFKKYWKSLSYFSFGLTWLIYGSWAVFKYSVEEHFSLALLFSIIFFAIFCISFLAYKLLRDKIFEKADIALILINSFVFYGIGYSLLDGHDIGAHYLGLYTLCNAFIHFCISIVIYKRKLADKNLFYLLAGLSLLFITIAIPVQLDGEWVTLAWAFQAALLFGIGRVRSTAMYESYAYPVMALAFLSLLQDWSVVYVDYRFDGTREVFRLLLNAHFLNSLLVIILFSVINVINHKKKPPEQLDRNKDLMQFINMAIPAVLIAVIYGAFFLEIRNYWDQIYVSSTIEHETKGMFRNHNLKQFSTVWLINYSLVFVALLSILNIKKIKSTVLSYASLVMSSLVIFAFLTFGLYLLSELREDYLQQRLAQYYAKNSFYISIRYVSYTLVAVVLAVMYRQIRFSFMAKSLKQIAPIFELFFSITLLWIVSSELLNIMDIMQKQSSYKLALSILWGVYSMLLISYGIWQKKKQLRIAAIVLFAFTLLKLFFYDIAHLDTISKTIVFVSLGVLLLIISFLYNKYKHIITEEDVEPKEALKNNDESTT